LKNLYLTVNTVVHYVIVYTTHSARHCNLYVLLMTELCIACNSTSCRNNFFLEEFVHWTQMHPLSAKVNRGIALELLKKFDAIVQAVNYFFSRMCPSKVNRGMNLEL
jgi:hypothetical protein